MTISYDSKLPQNFQEELNENLRNIENEVGSLDKQINHQHTVIEEHRLCFKSLHSLVEQQDKEIDQLKDEQQVYFDAIAHHKVAIDAIQSQINDLTRNLLEVTKAVTTFVQATDKRFNNLEKPIQMISE